MHILITNDDGIHAPGIRALIDELVKAHRITVCAPATEKSAASHSITILDPIRVQDISEGGVAMYAIYGTPADCVRLGLMSIVTDKVDMVVSGINRGANLGTDCLYSGTVAAAREAALQGVPALATSLKCRHRDERARFDVAARITQRIANMLHARPLPPHAMLNLNIPNLPDDEIRGVRVAPLSFLGYGDAYERFVSPRGQVYYWMQASGIDPGYEAGTDAALLDTGYCAITPLDWDLTRKSDMAELAAYAQQYLK